MVTKSLFGKTASGVDVYKYDLSSSELTVSILTFGATVQAIKVLTPSGEVDVALGYDTVSAYEQNDGYLGALVGRNCNRINGAKFTLNGVTYNLAKNDGVHNLHGGPNGFSFKVWGVEDVGENYVVMSVFSPDMEENFPGNIKVSVKYSVVGGDFNIEYTALSDKDTVCNLTNHAYFNLDGEGTKTGNDAVLTIKSNKICACDKDLVTTGDFIEVSGSPFDFNAPKQISKDINADDVYVKYMRGYDCNYCLDNNYKLEKIAEAYSLTTGICMFVATDRPGIQLYTSSFLTDRLGKNGNIYTPNTAFCLETQTYPGATSQPHFPTPFIKANEVFTTKTTYGFSVKKR